MRISDWSSDVCSSDLRYEGVLGDLEDADALQDGRHLVPPSGSCFDFVVDDRCGPPASALKLTSVSHPVTTGTIRPARRPAGRPAPRSEEHTSELQSLMRISYAVFCLKKKKNSHTTSTN